MIFDLWSLLVLAGLICLVGAGLWVILPRLYGLPRGSARPGQIRQALCLANVQPGERVYDLNASEGRALVIAAREFHARAIGVEVEPLHSAVALLVALFSGVIARVSLCRHSLFEVELLDANVVLLSLTPSLIARLQPDLPHRVRPGTRVVSLSLDLEGWEPSGIDIGHLIFLYQMPPTPGSIDTYLRSRMRGDTPPAPSTPEAQDPAPQSPGQVP
jgi:hypothetical protein